MTALVWLSMSVTDFEDAVAREGGERVYTLLIGWQIPSPRNPLQPVYTPLAITTSKICWEGFEVVERRGLFGTRKEERQAFTAVDVSEVESADVGKGMHWPARPSYDLALRFGSGFQLFMLENPMAIPLLRQAVEALGRVGVETLDRHDVFWAGGNDPYYQPP